MVLRQFDSRTGRQTWSPRPSSPFGSLTTSSRNMLMRLLEILKLPFQLSLERSARLKNKSRRAHSAPASLRGTPDRSPRSWQVHDVSMTAPNSARKPPSTKDSSRDPTKLFTGFPDFKPSRVSEGTRAMQFAKEKSMQFRDLPMRPSAAYSGLPQFGLSAKGDLSTAVFSLGAAEEPAMVKATSRKSRPSDHHHSKHNVLSDGFQKEMPSSSVGQFLASQTSYPEDPPERRVDPATMFWKSNTASGGALLFDDTMLSARSTEDSPVESIMSPRTYAPRDREGYEEFLTPRTGVDGNRATGPAADTLYPLTDVEYKNLPLTTRTLYKAVQANLKKMKDEAQLKGLLISPTCIEFISCFTNTIHPPSSQLPDGTFRHNLPPVDQAIQSGNFGRVFLARVGPRLCAIKMPSDTGNKEGFCRLFFIALVEDVVGCIDKLVHEARTLLLVGRHRNNRIVNMWAIHIGSFKEIWIIMDYANGYDLHELQIQGRHLQSFERLLILNSLLEGLVHLHTPKTDRGIIVHRDVKPENILVTGQCQSVLCDFGNAEHSERGAVWRRIKSVTWLYAPPEIITMQQCNENLPQAGPSWDMWSFGCVVVELIGCPHPFAHLLDLIDPPEIIRLKFANAIQENRFRPRLPRIVTVR